MLQTKYFKVEGLCFDLSITSFQGIMTVEHNFSNWKQTTNYSRSF